ncbi:MAG: ribosome maturation factor RimM [Propionibacteriaceae bacterium]|nr:ribosome maturation factor RimM [Propionibacteriaceae bacterium]
MSRQQPGGETIDVIVAVVGRAHGVKGDVVVHERTDSPQQRFAPGSRLIGEGRASAFTVTSWRRHAGQSILHLDGVEDRTAAEALRGIVLHAHVDPAESTGEEDAYFDHQLAGLTVLVDGQERGSVRRVEHGAAQDLLVVDAGRGERLVPFVDAFVGTVDLAGGTIEIRPIPGLLDDADEADPPAGPRPHGGSSRAMKGLTTDENRADGADATAADDDEEEN